MLSDQCAASSTSRSILWPPCSSPKSDPAVEADAPPVRPSPDLWDLKVDESQHVASVHNLLTALEADMKERFAKLDRKLDALSTTLGTGLDDVNVNIFKTFREAARVSRAVSKRDIDRFGVAPPKTTLRNVDDGLGRSEASDKAAQRDFALKRSNSMNSVNSMNSMGSMGSMNSMNSMASMASMASMVGEQVIAMIFERGGQRVWAQKIWTFLEDPESSTLAWWYSWLWSPFIMMSVLLSILQTVQPPPFSGMKVQILELGFDSIFVIELILRYIVSPTTWVFMQNPYNIIDTVASCPVALRPACLTESVGCQDGTLPVALLYCVTPVFRMLKTLRHFQQFHLFISLLSLTREALSVLLFVLSVIVLTCSSIVYLVEPRYNIESVPAAIYFVICTISTVGFGDITPESTIGTMAISGIIVCSVLYMAMPIGIIGNAFTQIWSDRDRILLTLKMRDRLTQWGYTAADMNQLFKHFDANGSGELDLQEFREMMTEMHIGISDERVLDLFESFDRDCNGVIDPKECTRALFPSTYHEIYSRKRTGDLSRSEDDSKPSFWGWSLPSTKSNTSSSKDKPTNDVANDDVRKDSKDSDLQTDHVKQTK